MLRDSVVVVRTRPRAIPLAKITMRKFCFLSHDAYGAPLGGPSGRRSSFTKIFLTLRHHQNQVQGHVQQPNQTNQLNIARYKKAVSCSIWLQLTLVACYLPYVIDVIVAAVFRAESGLNTSLYHARGYTITLVYLNSSKSDSLLLEDS